MKITTASSSDVMKYNRMDPAFHIALNSVKETMLPRVKAKYPKEQDAIDALEKLDTSRLKAVLPLSRGQAIGSQAIERAIKEYPHLSLALVLNDSEGLENSKRELQKQIDQLKNQIQVIDELSLDDNTPKSPKP